MSEVDEVRHFVEHMLRYTVRLVRNPTGLVVEGGIGSGVLLQRPAGLVLLTAGHDFDRAGTWTLETNIEVGRQTLMQARPRVGMGAWDDVRGHERDGAARVSARGPPQGPRVLRGCERCADRRRGGRIVSIQVSGVEEDGRLYGFPIHTVAGLIDATAASRDDAGNR